MNTIQISIEKIKKEYSIFLKKNIVREIDTLISNAYKGKSIIIIADTNAYKFHGEILQNALTKYRCETYFVAHPEQAKNLVEIEKITTWALDKNFDRHSLVICFGGGAVGDLGGFFASVFMRGIPFIQIPTTLLAQVDASVGGKTGVNTAQGKNLIGSFYHPQQVIIDPLLLKTLPQQQFYSGLAECIKAAIIGDEALFERIYAQKEWLPQMVDLEEIILRSIAVKAKIVQQDEQEKSIRMFLNLGHTTGHALETITNYDLYLHGEAVAFGCIVATIIAENRNIIAKKDSSKIQSIFYRMINNCSFATVEAEKIVEAMQYDKKKNDDIISFILPQKIGKVAIYSDIERSEIIKAINEVKCC